MNQLCVIPIGTCDNEIVQLVKTHLSSLFSGEVSVADRFTLPTAAYHRQRNQFEAIEVMRALLVHLPNDAKRVLAIMEEDLFIPLLTFVFGQAQVRGTVAVMSLARLRQEFYGLSPNSALLRSRALKEALHEVGHTFGLVHCTEARCAMALANNIQQVDAKLAEYCGGCQRLLREIFQHDFVVQERNA